MRSRFKNAKDVYKLLNFVGQYQTEIRLTCTTDGIHLFCMSSCHTVFIDCKLPTSYFEEYKCDVPEDIGLNLKIVLMALKTATPKDELIMHTESNDPDTVTFEIVKAGDQLMSYSIKQMMIDMDNLAIPQMNKDININLSSIYLKKWKSSILDFTKNSIVFKPTKNKLVVESTSKEMGQVKAMHGVPSIGINYVKFEGESVKPFTVGYTNILRAFNLSDVTSTVSMGWKSDMPLHIHSKLNEGDLSIYLAPMMDEMEED